MSNTKEYIMKLIRTHLDQPENLTPQENRDAEKLVNQGVHPE